MTFGHIKTAIEKNLLESYKNEKEFKKSLREFKTNILNNKSISKVYAVYDQLSTPQNLSESDAREFLSEGLNVIGKILPTIKLPKSLEESKENDYNNIDTLVYTNNLNLKERVEAKKSILNTLSHPFSGHTEYLAELDHQQQVVMMLCGEISQGISSSKKMTPLRVALATTHLPISQIGRAHV